MRQFPKSQNVTHCRPSTCMAIATTRLISCSPGVLSRSASFPSLPSVKRSLPKIVKIGELADFRRFQPRCTRHLRKRKIGVRRFSHAPIHQSQITTHVFTLAPPSTVLTFIRGLLCFP